MYSYSDITEVHLEITSKCQARCPMCPRRPYGGKLNPYIELSEITLEQFKVWFEVDFIKQLKRLFMCGNLGDPIVAKDTLEIFEYLRTTNPNISLSMNTNGSARTTEWWVDLAKLDVRVIFGLDGLEDTHDLYRINTDYNKIIENAKTFIDAGGVAEWHMLAFEHNEHQIEDCRKISSQMGFSKFEVKHTSRFKNDSLNVINDEGDVVRVIKPTARSKTIATMLEKPQLENLTIDCKAKKQNQIYVASNGIVSPCCWLDVFWFAPINETKIDYMNQIGVFPNLNNSSLVKIFSDNYFDEIEKTWNIQPLKQCTKQCGMIDKFGEQFK